MGEPVIRPFRAVRYDHAVAGDLGSLLAPPYDVSSPGLIAELHRRSPLNMSHLEHVQPDPGENPHEIVAERYRQWRAGGVLRTDERPALYRYDHTFSIDGNARTRRGIFGVVQLAHWDQRIVLPHERTFPGPVAERLGRLRAVHANLSPVYLLAHDPTGRFAECLNSEGALIAETADPDGEIHRLTCIEDDAVINEITTTVAATRLFVADGHHRYEAALALRDGLDGGQSGGSAFVLALIADAANPDVVILPTHRLVSGLPALDPGFIRRRLAKWFALEPAPAGSLLQACDISLVRFAGERGWWRLRPREDVDLEADMPPDRSLEWKRLPAAILESIVLEKAVGLDATALREHVRFTHDAAAADAAVDDGSAQIAFVLPAPTVTDLVAVAEAGDRMPPKSTYFYPKVPAGLVIYDFTQSR